MLMLSRGGYLWNLPKKGADNFKKVSDRFAPFSQAEMRGLLLSEFGKSFEITGTGNYLVVHPRGQRNRWASRFEELYRTAWLHTRLCKISW